MVTFNNINKSIKVNDHYFPSREDYDTYLSEYYGIIEPWNQPKIVNKIQLDWHLRGQNGCIFANIIAGKQEHYGWERQVFYIDGDRYFNIIKNIDEAIKFSIQSSSTNLLSIIFPDIVDEACLYKLILNLKFSKMFNYFIQ